MCVCVCVCVCARESMTDLPGGQGCSEGHRGGRHGNTSPALHFSLLWALEELSVSQRASLLPVPTRVLTLTVLLCCLEFFQPAKVMLKLRHYPRDL